MSLWDGFKSERAEGYESVDLFDYGVQHRWMLVFWDFSKVSEFSLLNHDFSAFWVK